LDVVHSPSTVASALPPFSSTQALDLTDAMHWERLEQANFKLNGIKRIDESVVSIKWGVQAWIRTDIGLVLMNSFLVL